MTGGRRLGAFVTGLTLSAALVWLLVEVALAISGESGLVNRATLDAWMRELQWRQDTAGWIVWGVVALIGVLLLFAGIGPGRRTEYLVESHGGLGRETVDRRGVEHRIRDLASSDFDVDSVRVTAGRRSVRMQVTPYTNIDRDALERRLSGEVRAGLEDLELSRRLKPRISVRRPDRRAR